MKRLKQYEVLKRASLFLAEHGREERVAQLLLQHHLGLSRSEFYMNMQEEISDKAAAAFEADIKAHGLTGVPYQHLTGYEFFYGRKFIVDKNVLIPRQETEELADYVIKQLKPSLGRGKRIVDIGTGSGVIAVTLALELPQAEILAADISAEALDVARKNAESLGAEVEFLLSDYLETLIQQGIRVDVIVSNPPYIAESERAELQDTVRDFDPELALFAAEDGLEAYQKIITQSKEVLHEDGLLAFEIGHTQGEAVKALILEIYPHADVDIIKDMNEKDRIVVGQLF